MNEYMHTNELLKPTHQEIFEPSHIWNIYVHLFKPDSVSVLIKTLYQLRKTRHHANAQRHSNPTMATIEIFIHFHWIVFPHKKMHLSLAQF